MKHSVLTVVLVVLMSFTASAHEIIKGTLKAKWHYPGTEREIQVYVPDAYDGNTRACLYVGLDGILCVQRACVL